MKDRFLALEQSKLTRVLSKYQIEKTLVDLVVRLLMGCQCFFNEELALNTEYISERSKLFLHFLKILY